MSHYVSLEDDLFLTFGCVLYLLSCLIKTVPFFVLIFLLFCAIVGGDGAVQYRYHKKGDEEREEGSTENGCR